MNTYAPGDTNIGGKLMEDMSERILPLFDMTDPTTQKNYWILLSMQARAMESMIQIAFENGLLKPAVKTTP